MRNYFFVIHRFWNLFWWENFNFLNVKKKKKIFFFWNFQKFSFRNFPKISFLEFSKIFFLEFFKKKSFWNFLKIFFSEFFKNFLFGIFRKFESSKKGKNLVSENNFLNPLSISLIISKLKFKFHPCDFFFTLTQFSLQKFSLASLLACLDSCFY